MIADGMLWKKLIERKVKKVFYEFSRLEISEEFLCRYEQIHSGEV